MPRRNNNALKNTTPGSAAFTLVELVLVMVVMVTLLAFIAPTLGRSFKQRGLDQEAVRMLALTEYGRAEAVSQGVPTEVWIDSNSGSYGVDAVPGYEGVKGTATSTSAASSTQSAPAIGVHEKQYSLPADVHFEVTTSHSTTAGHSQVIQFDPDGAPTVGTGIATIRIVGADNGFSQLTLTTDGWGYEINKGGQNAPGSH